uniref:Uncharacterized protein n=1 Tax=Peronospora matthiolae TaxID=2874970 RepID=A0AAV1VC95_9STRA
MKEVDREIDLEDKPRPPPRIISGATADRSPKIALPDENPMVKTKPAKAEPYLLVDRSLHLKPRKTISRSTTPSRAKMKTLRSEGEDRQIDQTVESNIRVREEHDKKLDEIAMPKTEYDPVKISPMENVTANKW